MSCFAHIGSIDPEELRKSLASQYVTEFVQEFNEFSAQDVKDIYGFFMPEKERPVFFQGFKIKPHARGVGNILYLDMPSGTSVKVELIDLLEQRYKINGKIFAYDWTGDMTVQLRSIRGRFKKKTAGLDRLNPIMDMFLPAADAQGWEEMLIAGALLTQACVDGACEALALFAGRAAVFATAREAFIRALASSAGKEAMAVAKNSFIKSGKFTWQMITRVITFLEKDPEIAKAFESMKSLKDGETWGNIVRYAIKAPFKTIGWFANQFKSNIVGPLLGTLVGIPTAIGFAIVNAAADDAVRDKKIPKLTGVYCFLRHGEINEACEFVKPQIQPSPKPVDDLKVEWCNTDNVNEYQIYLDKGEGRKIAIVVRLDVSEKNKGHPLSATRYEIKDSSVDPQSVRKYKWSGTDLSEISKMTATTPIWGQDIATKRRHFDGPDGEGKEVADMAEQVKRREGILNPKDSKDEVIYKGDIIKDLGSDSLKTHVDEKAEALIHEYQLAQEMLNMLQFGQGYCDLSNKTETAKAVPGPGASLPTTSK